MEIGNPKSFPSFKEQYQPWTIKLHVKPVGNLRDPREKQQHT